MEEAEKEYEKEMFKISTDVTAVLNDLVEEISHDIKIKKETEQQDELDSSSDLNVFSECNSEENNILESKQGEINLEAINVLENKQQEFSTEEGDILESKIDEVNFEESIVLEGKPGKEEIIGVISDMDIEAESEIPKTEAKMVVMQSGGITLKVKAESLQCASNSTEKDNKPSNNSSLETDEIEFRPPTPDPRFRVMPSASRGKELSGLCCIM